MEIVFVLIPISILLVLGALAVFSWAIDSGQFEDLDREARRILMEDEGPSHADDRRSGRSVRRESTEP
jgi:cbb3-type cytochrome oxidase maturation protein